MHRPIVAAAIRALVVTGVLGTLMLILAGTFAWPGLWLFLAAMAVGGFGMEAWLARNNPILYAERRNTRQQQSTSERILLPLLHGLFFLWLLWMAFDVRMAGTAQMPVWANILAAAIVLAAFGGNIAVFRANAFASAIVRIQDGQRVADTGPYRIVRHPMYAFGVATYAAIPLVLGSWIGLAGVPVLTVLLAIRIQFEEKLLRRQLPGYADYAARVRYRLIPFVW